MNNRCKAEIEHNFRNTNPRRVPGTCAPAGSARVLLIDDPIPPGGVHELLKTLLPQVRQGSIPTTLMIEHGTATIHEAAAALLRDAGCRVLAVSRPACAQNAEAQRPAVAGTLPPLVGHSESGGGRE